MKVTIHDPKNDSNSVSLSSTDRDDTVEITAVSETINGKVPVVVVVPKQALVGVVNALPEFSPYPTLPS